MAKAKIMPAEANPLVKDEDCKAAYGNFSYSSLVGIILYIYGNISPDVAFFVNCCSQYVFCPKWYHKFALNILSLYFNHTKDCGLVLSPNNDLCTLNCYPGTNFLGCTGTRSWLTRNVWKCVLNFSFPSHIFHCFGFKSYIHKLHFRLWSKKL